MQEKRRFYQAKINKSTENICNNYSDKQMIEKYEALYKDHVIKTKGLIG